jgi:SNF2 family DNA or RNA helicase
MGTVRQDLEAENAELRAKLDEIHRQAEEDKSEVERLTERFKRRAEGKLWYEGTGNDDAILPHQWLGAMFGAVAERWICGDQMGLGKTRVAIGWLDLIRARRVVVITEPNLTENFAGEVMTYAPHRTLTNIAQQRKDRRHELLDAALSKDEGVIVMNYEIFRQDKDTLAKVLGWQADTVIVDEAHNIKATRTANYRYVEAIVKVDNQCPKCKGLLKGLYEPESLKAKHPVPRPCPACGWKKGDDTGLVTTNKLVRKLQTRSVKNLLMMTGTPLLNEPGDIYPMLHLIDPMMFLTMREFRALYCTKNYHSDKWEFRAGAMNRLRPLIEGRFLARTLSDAGVELPEHRIHVVPVDLDRRPTRCRRAPSARSPRRR